jgi:hypothetical protein
MAKTPTEIKSLARAHTDAAINCLVGVMNQPDSPHSARVSAATALLDRGWGKPAQAIIGGDDDDKPVKHVHRIEREIVDPQHQDGPSIPAAS